MRFRRSFAPRRRRLTGISRSRRLVARVRLNIAINSREQSSIQSSVREQIPAVQFPIRTLSPPLEISYSPISNPSPVFPADFPPHSPSLPPITQFPISDTIPSIPYVQPDDYSLAGHLPLLFHDAQQLLEYMTYFTPSYDDQVIVKIAGSDGLFSVPIPSLIPFDPFSFLWSYAVLIFPFSNFPYPK